MSNGREAKVSTMLDDLCMNTDFDLLYAQKLCLDEALNHGTPIPKPALEGLVNLLDKLGDLGETLGRFQYEGIEPPFPLQPDYEKKIVVFEPEPEPKMHVLCSEHEGSDGIREFFVLGMSRNKEDLQPLMRAKIEKDEYGLIAENGICEEGDSWFKTNFEEGFVEYYILEEEVLSKDRIQELLNSEEYDTSFRYPEGFRDLLVEQLRQFVANEGYGDGFNFDKAADHFMEDKNFQGQLKSAWWFYPEHLANDQRSRGFCTAFVRVALDENPDLFEEIGAVPPYCGPDNIRDALVPAIYDAAKAFLLPSLNVGELAEECLRSPKLRTMVSEQFADVVHLYPGSEQFNAAMAVCYAYLADRLDPKQERRPGLDQIIAGAAKRTEPAVGKEKGAEQER